MKNIPDLSKELAHVRLMEAVHKSHTKWIDKQFKKLIPREIYRLVKKGKIPDESVSNYLSAEGYKLAWSEDGLSVQIQQHGKIIAQHSVDIIQKKIIPVNGHEANGSHP